MALLSITKQNENTDGFRASLTLELENLRMQLANADNLIQKMIWAKLIATNLQWQAVLSRHFDAQLKPVKPLTLAERSLRRAIKGEFGMIADTLQRTALAPSDKPVYGLAVAALFKRNRTINALAPRYTYVSEVSELSPKAFAKAVAGPQAPLITETGWLNIAGNAFLRIKPPSYLLYASRLQDLDSRIALLNRVADLPKSPIQTDIDHLAISNPYQAGEGPQLQKDGRVCFDGPLADELGVRCLRL